MSRRNPAHAGAAWGRTDQGPVQLLYQINMERVGFQTAYTELILADSFVDDPG